MPEPPPEVTGEALAEWHRVMPVLAEAGIISKADQAMLSVYCTAVARLRKAEQHLATTGEVVKSPTGHPMQNPWLQVAKDAARHVKQFGEELGLSPASRSRIKLKPAPKANPFKVFMDGKKRA